MLERTPWTESDVVTRLPLARRPAPSDAGAGPAIGIGHFGAKGRGVVALRDLAADTQLERCPVLIIPAKDRARIDPSIVFTYVFMWEHGTSEQDLYRGQGRAGIALGLSSLLNHSYSPTARFIRHIDSEELELRSLVPLAKGDEVTIDYQMDLWFDPA